MNSPKHRENILEQGFTEIGIATAKGEYEGEETVFVVQMFGRPSADELADRNDSNQQLAVAGDTSNEEPVETVAVEESQQEPAAPASTEGDSDQTQEEPAEPINAEDDTETATSVQETTPVEDEAPTPASVAQVQGEAGISLLPFSGSVERQASQFAHLLSQPDFLFRTLILTLFALIALALLVSVGLEAKRHHVNHAFKSFGALAVLMIVFFLGTTFLFPEPEVSGYSDSRLSAEISLQGSTPSR
jgi:ABC-type multidrug transport system fused ATPase/permease subunit